MQVSYGKLTVNDGKEMEARRHTIGRCHVALQVGNWVFRRLEKVLYFMTRV